MRHAPRLIAPLLILLAGTTVTAGGQQQDSARAGVSAAQPPAEPAAPAPSSIRVAQLAPGAARRPPISPRAAFLYSLAVPGLGQSKIDRSYAGALFFSVEAVAIAMLRQSLIDLHYAQHHINDSTLVVLRYAIDSTTGQLQRDPKTGQPIPAAFAYSRYDSARVAARKTHVEDWKAVLIFNHLLAGADAFVAAQLWDLPAHVRPIALNDENGRTLIGAAVSW